MVISLNEVMDQPFWLRLGALVTVGILLTLGVYGAVGLLVKMDDIGLALLKRHDGDSAVGTALVKGMPIVLNVIGIIGTVAMLWVGGHLIIRGFHEVFGWHWPHDLIERGVEAVGGGSLGWLVDTGISLVTGLIVGLIVLAIVSGVKKVLPSRDKEAGHQAA